MRTAVLLTLAALLAVAAGCRRGEDAEPEPQGPQTSAPEGYVDLYFPSETGFLGVERRPLELEGGAGEQVRTLVAAWLEGPTEPGEEGLVPAFPDGLELAEAFVTAEGVAVVDLAAPEGGEPPSTGSMLEMQRIYSLVDSVVLNVAGVRRVTILWNGRQRETLSGHVDTSVPLAPMTELMNR